MAEVLLVDDDASVLLTLSIALRRHGHEVTVACDGQQALQQLSRRHFDVLLTDIRMPGMSGLELAKRACSKPDAPHIILTSAHYDPGIFPNPAAQLAEAFLPKPIDVEKLQAILARHEVHHSTDHNRQSHPVGATRHFFGAGSPLPQAG